MTAAPTQTYPPSQQPGVTDNVMGLVGFIASILGFVTCGFLAPIALVLSLIGLMKRPRALAVAGVVISVIGCVLLLTVGWGLWWGYVTARSAAQEMGQTVSVAIAEASLRDAYRQNNNIAPDDAQGQAVVDAAFAQQQMDQTLWVPRYRKISDTAGELTLPGADRVFGTADDVTESVDYTVGGGNPYENEIPDETPVGEGT